MITAIPAFLLLTTSGLVGCRDNGVTAFNAEPKATITSHKDGDVEWEAYTTTFRGSVSDPDHKTEELLVTWYVGGLQACTDLVPDADGSTTCTVLIGPSDSRVDLQVQDAGLATGSDTVTLFIKPTSPPSVDIVTPQAGDQFYSDQKVSFSAVVGDEEDAPTTLLATWSSDIDGTLNIAADPDTSGDISSVGYLTEGQHLITLTVQDTTAKISSDDVLIVVGGPNNLPSCELTGPEGGTSFVHGDVVTFSGTVSDVEIPANELSVIWWSDRDGDLSTSVPSSAGEVLFATSTLSIAPHTISLRVEDEVGGSCSDLVVLTVGTAPQVELSSPVELQVYNVGDTVTITADVSDAQDRNEDIHVSFNSNVDGELGAVNADASGKATIFTDTLARGAHVITATATDTDGLGSSDIVTFTMNGVPSAPTIALSPSPPHTSDAIKLSIVVPSIDPEGSGITYDFAWYKDGFLISDITGNEVDSTHTTKNETWRVVVTPNDGTGDGEAAERTVVVANTLPVLADVDLSPNPATTDTAMTCTPGATTDPDFDTISHTYAWEVSGTMLSASGSTLPSSWYDRGDEVRCVTTPHDGDDAGVSIYSDTSSVINSPPTIAAVTILPNPALVGDSLVCSYSTFVDADGDDDGSGISWTINGMPAGSSSYLSTGFTGLDDVECTVTPWDGFVSGSLVTDFLTVMNTPPVLDAVTLTPYAAYEGDSLLCTAGTPTDADGHSVSFSVGWFVDGTKLAVVSSSLSSGYFDRDNVVYCEVTPNDGHDNGDAVRSNTVTISNTPPSLDEVTLSPDPAWETSTMTCNYGVPSDNDGDAVTVSTIWNVSGIVLGVTDEYLSGVDFSRGDTVSCTATPSDGTAVGGSLSSNVVTVQNTPPTIDLVSITPSPAYATDGLSCTYDGFVDVDGDDDKSSLLWSINGIPWTTDPDLSTGYGGGDLVACTITPDDGIDVGTPVTDAIAITNSIPVVIDATLSPSIPDAGDAISCIPGSTQDADGDAVNLTYTWEIDGAPSTYSGSSLPVGSATRGQTVNCSITPYDGTDYGTTVYSTSATLVNSLPVVSDITITPATIYTNDIISVSFTTSDADYDPVSVSYTWLLNSSALPLTGSSIDGTVWFDKGDVVLVYVTPSDGLETGFATSSNPLVIENSPPSAPVAEISPAEPPWDQDFTCMVTGPSSDDDGDLTTYSMSWTHDGLPFTGTGTVLETDDTILADESIPGDTYICTVVPNDGTDDGEATIVEATVKYPTFLGWGSGDEPLGVADHILVGEAEQDAAGVNLGYAGDVDGDGLDDLLVGAFLNDEVGDAAGKVYLVMGGMGTTGQSELADADFVFYPEFAGDGAGATTVGAGDVDGDGLADILIGAPYNQDADTDAGKVYLVLSDDLGSTGTVYLNSAWHSFLGANANDYLGEGEGLAGAGDIDGDGLDDIMMGAFRNDVSATNAGGAYVFTGASLATAYTELELTDADHWLLGEYTQDQAGFSISGPGDVDGDGYDDMFVGAAQSNNAGADAGSSYLVLASDLSTGAFNLGDAHYTITGEKVSDYSGQTVSGAGDVDGDGKPDLLIGAYQNDNSASNSGSAYLVRASSLSSGGGTLALKDADYVFMGESANDNAGVSVRGVGDVDGDGFDDIVVGSYWNDDGGINSGKAYLILGMDLGGSGSMMLRDAHYSFYGELAGDYAGLRLAGAGDMDGNGLSDVVVGAKYNDRNGANAGAVYILLSPGE